MKTIMFNDNPFMLTDAVMSGRKTQTRLLVPASHLKAYNRYIEECSGTSMKIGDFLIKRGFAKYIVGEEVAIAQSYESLGLSPHILHTANSHDKKSVKNVPISKLPGWNNKLYVSADYMPHSIIITGVRVEHLQRISTDDVQAEGLIGLPNGGFGTDVLRSISLGNSPRTAYSKLIDALCKKKVWNKNPLVYVYEFRFVK